MTKRCSLDEKWREHDAAAEDGNSSIVKIVSLFTSCFMCGFIDPQALLMLKSRFRVWLITSLWSDVNYMSRFLVL